ncbi:non-ribosomal peptide synthetase [Dyella sedimenti]|uniref:non-ribosomal peptide synthetase n=1 Tax=Dyella sedimenti TaxID=2919947 RepID=UPI001FAAB98E|nr:non-ribosomal peptide synthetase [Dyella sedimenti]
MSPNDSLPLSAAAVAVDYDPFAGSTLARVVPATAPQREVWLASTLEPAASLAYNESISLRLHGELDAAALRAALQQLMDRHEALRATFGADGGELCIAAQQALPCALRDLSWMGPDEQESDVALTLERAVTTPFDLEHGPLVRAELLRLAPQEHLLVFTAHHIVCDGWSFGVIVRDLAALYAQQLGMGGGLPPADPFADYALAEAAHAQSQTATDDEAYWLRRFAGGAPMLDLPTDRPRPRRRSFCSRREDLLLDPALVADVKRLGAQRGASLYATLLAAFGLLLQRLSGQDEVVIGIPSAGQAAGGHHALVGHCVNVLPLRVAIDPATPFADGLALVRGDLLDAFDHQQYTIGSLLARLALPRDPGRLPLASVLFNLDQALDERTVSFPGLSFEFAGNPRAYENFELFVNAVQVQGGVRLECQYNSELFEDATIRAWLDAYATLLRRAAATPEAPGGALGLVSEPAWLALQALQPSRTPYPEQQLAHEYFEAQVDRAPSRLAIDGAAPLGYAGLESRANRIAHVLRARGVGRGSLVGLSLARGADMVAALLGVLKSGAGYVPLDPGFPAERLAFMAEDAALAALIVDDEASAAFAFLPSQVLSLRRDAALIEAASDTRLPRDERSATPESEAYLIYTSGSTGKPKGVRVPHRAAANFITAMQREPGIGEDDRLVAVTTLSFDIAFLELMLPLSVGAAIVLASYDEVRDGAALRRLVERHDATMMQATPAGWRILLESGWPGRQGFKAIAGGEPLPLDLAETLLERCGELWNAYGPTETTVWSTLWRVSDPRAGIFIGRPIANTTVVILDERGQPCPLGMPGEIHIGGDGVTLGYLNRPALSAERFLPDPWAARPQARLYRTGDRGRWLANGLLEHRGRLDFQVKIRGYRIELGEIESALADLPGIARAVVVAREERPGDVRLVAYVVPAEGAAIEDAELGPQLRQRLPDYMVPQHVMALEAIPLLPNGKIDRKSLPAPPVQTVATQRERQAPQGDTEQRVAAAMEAVLALPGLDARDNFFALGGHSLLAAQLTARLNREFDLALSFRTLFDAPTIAGLAATIDQLKASGAAAAVPPIERRADQRRAPLSLMQQRLWALEELQPGRVTYNAPSAHRLRGRLDEAAFEQAMRALMQRQPILRTAFRREDGEVMQVVEDIGITLFPAEDLSALPADEREAELMRRLQVLTDTPFDLARAPLFSARMFRLADDEHVFFFMPHHIIWDGWSFDILYAELSQLYKAFAEGSPSPLPPLPVSYGDYAAWHAQWLESEPFAAQLGYWRERLGKAQETRALPTDHPRRPGMSGIGRTEWIRVSKEATDAMHAVARQADATLNMALLALYYVMLSGMTGERHLVVGTPVRARNHTDVESVMGYFNNLLPLHVTVDPSRRFIDFVRQVKDAAIESFGHPDVPLEYLQRELRSGHGNGAVLYQALFSFQDARQRVVDWGGLGHEQILLFQSGATEDLGLWFLENAQGLLGGVTYNADILQAETARLQRDRYLALMARVSADPRQTIDALIAADEAELDQLRAWNEGADAVEPDDVVAQFEAQADARPQAPALAVGDWTTAYGELEMRANRVAACLRRRGAKPGSVVALCAAPGVGRLSALLGILKVGGTVLPLDPDDPPARWRDLLDDAGASLMVGDAALEATLEWPRQRALWLDSDTDELIAASAMRADAPRAAPEQPAFACYVPGADGLPRGVAIGHRALALMLHGLRDALQLGPCDSVLGTAPATTGLAMLEHLLPLVAGARFTQAGHGADGQTLAHLIDAGEASVMFATPPQWQSLLAAGWQGRHSLKAVCTGGMPSPALATALSERCAGVWSLFGADESASALAVGRIDRPAECVHSGHPLGGAGAWVLDAQQRPCPAGAIGEIHVDGATLSQPFGQRSALDLVRAGETSAAPLRATGFRGRRLADGQLQPLGRYDRRVRVHGHEVDPATVEAALLAQSGVTQAVAVARASAEGDVQLAAYAVAGDGGDATRERLHAALARVLAAHAMPRHLTLLGELPRLPDGSVDLAALPPPGAQADDLAELAVQPKTSGEQLLAGIWRELLHLSQVRTSDNFFDIGGHSLLAVEMAARVQRDTGVRLNLLDIANGTLATLAAELAEAPAPSERGAALGQRLRKLFGRR